MPQRIQRKRTAGWKKPAGAVYVGRGSRWGNPFRVGHHYADRAVWRNRPQPLGPDAKPGVYRHEGAHFPWTETIAPIRDRAHAVELFRAYIAYEDIDWPPELIRQELGGRDLMCWCRPDSPCHADVLLRLANEED